MSATIIAQPYDNGDLAEAATQHEVAARLGISQQAVFLAEHNALRALWRSTLPGYRVSRQRRRQLAKRGT